MLNKGECRKVAFSLRGENAVFVVACITGDTLNAKS